MRRRMGFRNRKPPDTELWGREGVEFRVQGSLGLVLEALRLNFSGLGFGA